jgi:hypothetical protein
MEADKKAMPIKQALFLPILGAMMPTIGELINAPK